MNSFPFSAIITSYNQTLLIFADSFYDHNKWSAYFQSNVCILNNQQID